MSTFSGGRLLKDLVTYTFSDLIVRAAAFLSMPIYTRILSPGEYGLWGALMTVVVFTQGIVILGCDSAYARWFFQAKTEVERRVLTSTLVLFMLAWGAGLAALVYPARRLISQLIFQTPDHGMLVALAVCTVPVTLINLVGAQAVRNQFQGSRLLLQNLVFAIGSIAASLVLILKFKMGVAGIFLGTLAAGLLILPLRLWAIRPFLGLHFDARLLQALLSYGLPLVPGTLAYWVFSGSDRILVSRLGSLEQAGYYSAAAVGAGVLAVLNSALGQAWTPHAMKLFEQDREKASVIYGRTLTYILAVFGGIAVLAATFAPEALRLVATARFLPAAAAVGPLALGIMASASGQVTALGMNLMQKTWYLSLHAWIAAVLNVLLNLWAIPRWGIAGAGWSTAAAYGYLTIAYAFTSQRFFRVVYERRRILVIAVLSAGFAAGTAWWPLLPWGESLALKFAYVLCFVILLGVFRAFGLRDWADLKSLIRGSGDAGVNDGDANAV